MGYTGQKAGGQDLLGGLDCTVHRNFFGCQVVSLPLPLIESGQFAAFRISDVNELIVSSSSLTDCTKQLQSCILNLRLYRVLVFL